MQWFTVVEKRGSILRLLAISDLHVDFKANMAALREVPDGYQDDWLILGGDICTTEKHTREALDLLAPKFAKLIWVPGNHELWSSRGETPAKTMLHGEEKYRSLVEVCREYGVATPEDPYPRWSGAGGPAIVAPLFIPYDYSFRPDHVSLDGAIPWAQEAGIMCTDERAINPAPYDTIIDWCAARVKQTEERLAALDSQTPLILVNHFPLRRDLVRLRRIPRFIIWCGTRLTEDWHRRFPVKAVISGHLHVRATDYRDGVRFEEVSLGYPRHWERENGVHHYFRQILPSHQYQPDGDAGPFWRYFGGNAALVGVADGDIVRET